MNHVSRTVCLVCLMLTIGCGGMRAKRYSESTAGHNGERVLSADKKSPEPMAPHFVMEEEAEAVRMEGGEDEDALAMPEPSPPPVEAKPESSPPPVEATPAKPMVVYSGFLKLRVKRQLEAMDQVAAITEELGGYVESMTEAVIVVRIPKGDFDGAMKAFLEVGELLDRRVSSEDVTAAYYDLMGRLVVAKEARERLLKLLEEVKKVKERLRILKEIKRLTEQIEYIESKINTLRNLEAYFTITIGLEPVIESGDYQREESPFPWVRRLSAHQASIDEGKDEISMTLPMGFVLFEEADTYRAQAADTAAIRAGVVTNEPLGDNGFWSDAVAFEMIARGEIEVDAGTVGRLAYRLYHSDDVTPRFFLVAVYTQGEDIYVVEVFYPNEDSKKEHHDRVMKALETLEVTP